MDRPNIVVAYYDSNAKLIKYDDEAMEGKRPDRYSCAKVIEDLPNIDKNGNVKPLVYISNVLYLNAYRAFDDNFLNQGVLTKGSIKGFEDFEDLDKEVEILIDNFKVLYGDYKKK